MDDLARWQELMRLGDYTAAWRLSDTWLDRVALPLSGKRVLVRCEHGLGDTIQFVRFAPLLDARVTVAAQPSLVPLLRTIDGIDVTDADVEHDVAVEIMDLAHVFRATPLTLPACVPYLRVPPAPLPRNGRRRVGIVWRSGEWDKRRDVPLPFLASLADRADVALYSLQKERRESDPHVKFVDGVDDPLGTARLMRALDLVISVDTMPAHLAGALGVPVWTLLHADADWRWMQDRNDSPWYPTMRLFRQRNAGDWEPVVARIVDALKT